MATTVQPASKDDRSFGDKVGTADVEQDGCLLDLLVGQEDADKARHYQVVHLL